MNFKGNLVECLEHFLGGATDKSDEIAKKQELMSYVKVSANNNVANWLNKKHRPRGLVLLRMMFFLEGKGYTVAELETINGDVRAFGRLIFSGGISYDEARRTISYKDKDSLMRVLLGKVNTTHRRARLMARIVLERSGKASPPVEKWDSALLHKTEPAIEKEIIIEAMASITKMVILFGERVVSDDFTAEDRRRVRSSAGNGAVFKASNLLNSLCGEKARAMIKEQQKAERRIR